MTSDATTAGRDGAEARWEEIPGIVITDRKKRAQRQGRHPRIRAFIWGGKVRPHPTLPYGRWKGAA